MRAELIQAFTRPEITVLHVPFNRDLDMKQHQGAWAWGTKAAEEAIS